MKSLYASIFFLLVSVSVQAQTTPTTTPPATPPPAPVYSDKTLDISMVTSNSIADNLPETIFAGQKFQAEPNSRYTKLHLYADQPFNLGKFEIESCNLAATHPTTYFINFDVYSGYVKADGGMFKAAPNFTDTRSLTLNFGENTGICIQAIRLFDSEGKLYRLHTQKTVTGSVTASTTLEPLIAYDALNLFDSRFENAWSTKGKSVGEFLQLNFAEDVTVTKMRFWNGYQRSPMHCVSNSRPKTIALSGDGGYAATITINDAMEPQTIDLPKPFTGKSLKLTVTEAYPGRKYADLVISEMRLFNGTDWFSIDPLPAIKRASAENRAQFSKAGLDKILNQSLNGEETAKKQFGGWTFRFRADGSLYLEGYADEKNSSVNYYAIGNFEVKEAAPTHLRVRVFGILRKVKYPYGGDCNGCGQDCNKLGQNTSIDDSTQTEQIFQDFLTISQKDGLYVIENKEAVKQLKLTKIQAMMQ